MSTAKRRALAIRDRYGLRSPPTDEALLAVCEAEGLTVLDGCPELVGRVREVLIEDCLCLACDLDPCERRWLIAHGLGHWLLHKPGVWFFHQDARAARSQQEWQAEAFAGWLLCAGEDGGPPPLAVLEEGVGAVCAWARAPYLSVERWLRAALAPGVPLRSRA